MYLPYLISGCLFFVSSFVIFRNLLRVKLASNLKPENVEAVATSIATRLVSTIQAVLACTVGLITIVSCDDVIWDVSPVLLPYCWFALPYMVYDVYAMFVTHQTEQPYPQESIVQVFKSFLRKRWLLTFHHLGIVVLGLPILVYFRNGKGDFFIGCLMLTELSTPFLSLRSIMKKLQWSQPTLILINDLLFVSIFFVCRILLFPYMYWAYARYTNLPVWHVPSAIPVKCNIGCLFILLIQCMWFRLILLAAWKRMSKSSHEVQKVEIQPSVEVNCNHVQKKVSQD